MLDSVLLIAGPAASVTFSRVFMLKFYVKVSKDLYVQNAYLVDTLTNVRVWSKVPRI